MPARSSTARRDSDLPHFLTSPLVCLLTLMLIGVGLFSSPLARAATPPGTVITNRAEVLFTTPSGARKVFASNQDNFTVVEAAPPPTASRLGFYRIDSAGTESAALQPARFRNPLGAFLPLTPPASAGNLARYRPATSFRVGEWMLLQVSDADQNYSTVAVESVRVQLATSSSADLEIFELYETGPDTGVFAGLVPLVAASEQPHDGQLSATTDTRLVVTYTDTHNAADSTTADILIDPFGLVFASDTGAPLDGIAVTLIDDSTGRAAEVFGIDGLSAFPSTVLTGQTVTDASGRSYPLDPGAFVFPLVRPGRYRYAVQPSPTSGFTFPSTASVSQLAELPGAPFALSIASTGEAFDVTDIPIRTDLPLDSSTLALALTLSTATPVASAGDFVRFDLELSNRRGASFQNVRIEDQLPAGLRIEKNSLLIEGRRAALAVSADGRGFSFNIPAIAAGQTMKMSYLVRVAATKPGRLVNSARAVAGRLETTPATAGLLIRDELQATRAHILGRVIRWENGAATTQGLPGVAVYLETGAMSVTDARGFYRFEGLQPGTHVVQIDTATLPPGASPILPRDSTEHAGRAWSRFADVAAGILWNADFFVDLPANLSKQPAAAAAPSEPVEYNQSWIDAETPTQDWLLPDPAAPLPTPAVKVLVKHHPAHTIAVLLNGHPVAPIAFEGTLRSNRHPLAASLWRGVNLREGENVFEVVRTDSFGIERHRERRVIHFAAAPVRAELIPGQSTLVADGVTAPVIALRFFDRNNHPARSGLTGRFSVRQPYQAWRDEKILLANAPGTAPETPAFTIGADGVALLKLAPTAASGTARLLLSLAEGEREISADLRSHRQDWLVIGVAESTSAGRTLSGHLENAAADDLKDGFSHDGRVAFFVKGRIRGNWLLTAAYDSAKEKKQPRSLHGLIDPDAYYTVYGDESERLENAPSSRKLYVKLERDAIAALFGDFTLDWTSTAFTTYSRELHGAKADYRGKKLRASIFQSDAGLTNMREEFPGNGLSGPYVLGRRPLVAFSERLTIQERDRLRPDIVVSEKPLSRGTDYTIDSYAGIVRLGAPLFSTSTALNPQVLVVQYELEDATAGVIQGARAEYGFTEKTSVGSSHLREEHNGKTSTLTGVDARVQLTTRLAVTAEAAQSDTTHGTAEAYRTEAAYRTQSTDTRVYFREIGAGFGLNQLNTARLANRQTGLEATQQLSTQLSARQSLYEETLLPSGDQRLAGEGQLEWTRGVWSYRSGLRAAQDTRGELVEKSVLATAGLSRRFFKDRLELRADREQSVAGEAENLDFPTRTVLGATYALTEKTSLLAVQEWTDARGRKTAVSQLGLKSNPWTGGTVTGGVTQSFAGTPSTTLGSGLNQVVRLTPKLSLEGAFERSDIVHGTTDRSVANNGGGFSSGSPFHASSGYASAAQGESTSAFAGFHWQPRAVLYHSRVEINESLDTRRVGLLASAQTSKSRDLGLLAGVRVYDQSSDRLAHALSLDARLGAAWRPAGGGTTVLERLDFVHTPSSGSEGNGAGGAWKVIENLHVNQRLHERLQTSLHLGAKYVFASIDRRHGESFTTLAALETRYNFTSKWDFGLNGAALSLWGQTAQRWSCGISIGRTVAKNMWVSVGYNFSGFTDTDFTAARYTAPGVYLRFRLKFDHESLAGLINAIKAE